MTLEDQTALEKTVASANNITEEEAHKLGFKSGLVGQSIMLTLSVIPEEQRKAFVHLCELTCAYYKDHMNELDLKDIED